MLYIGIDLGTSAVKLLLMNEAGEILHVVSRDYPLEFPRPGWSQQNPADWQKAVWEGIPLLLEGFDGSQVAGIGAGGQMHGLVVLDEEDRVIRPAILWNDGRTAKQVTDLNETVGRDRLSQWTANIAFAGFTAPKLLWMREQEPELFARIKKVMLPKDYINYLLTGVHCTDYSDASGMLLLDVANKRWSRDMLALCGLTEAQMPRLYESYETVGTLLPEVAQALGLPQTVRVAAGAGDNAAAAVGTGTVGRAAATFPWAPPAPSSSLRITSGWTPTMPSTPLPMPTGATISWAVCSPPPPVTSGSWRTSSARRITPPSRRGSRRRCWAATTCISCPTSWGSGAPSMTPTPGEPSSA